MPTANRVIDRAAELVFSDSVAGLGVDTVQEAGDELARLLAAIGNTPSNPTPGTYLTSGGRLLYQGTGYQYTISAGSGYINGIPVSWLQQNVTLAAADATNDRIDVFVVSSVGVVTAITGTPAATPSRPDTDPTTQLALTFAIVYANTSTPTGTSITTLYAENLGSGSGEFDASTSNGGAIALASTTTPRAGTKCIRATAPSAASTITLTAAAPFDPSIHAVFQLPLKIVSAWANGRSISLRWKLGTVSKGNAITVIPGQNGLSNSNTTDYQIQALLVSTFGIPSGATVDRLVITTVGGAISFALDDIQLQAFVGVTVVSTTGVSQSEADTRYAQRANNLSDLASAATSRTNLGVSTGSVQVSLGDGVNAITTSESYQDLKFPFACTITDVELLADTLGSIVLGLWKDTYANYPPVAGDSIVASAPPTLSAAIKSQDSTLTGWTTAIAAGDILRVTVTSATTVKRVTLKIGFTR